MSVLRLQSVREIKKAFSFGLIMVGVENGRIMWLGERLNEYFND